MSGEIEFSELLQAVSDERVKRWLWQQLPEHARYEGNVEDFIVDSVRLRYDPIKD